jgi:hypothetical protein
MSAAKKSAGKRLKPSFLETGERLEFKKSGENK